MKWKKTQQTATEGVIFVETVVNKHGSIFRSVPQETDVGIDGYIELVKTEEVSGWLVATQIKSGDSYLSSDSNGFAVAVDQQHLDYWYGYMVPVVLICYSPSKNVGAWVSVRDYIDREKAADSSPIKSIHVPFSREFNVDAIAKGITGLAHVRADERILLKCADMCLSDDPLERRQGISILQAHPDSRGRRITTTLARKLLADDDSETSKDAMFALGYCVAHDRWSFGTRKPGLDEKYAIDLCRDLTPSEIHRMVENTEGEYFRGPQAIGERCFDILCCCEHSQRVLEDMAANKSLPMAVRANALYMVDECDEDIFAESVKEDWEHPDLGEVYRWMTESDDDDEPREVEYRI